jgi:anti-sigma-K factor RskA
MTADHDERWTDAVGAYLLGAMPKDEEAAFEDHLDACPECRGEVEHLRVAAEALPASPMQFEPPPELKQRIMSIVNAEAELLRAAGPQADRAPVAPRRRWFTWRPALAYAAVAAAAAIVVGVVALGGGGGDRIITADIGSAKLIERDSGHSTLTASHLRSPGPGRVYQVWLQRAGGKPQPTNALFGVRRDGTASVDVPGSVRNVDTVMVTSEPEGGSTAPTTRPVIVAHPA